MKAYALAAVAMSLILAGGCTSGAGSSAALQQEVEALRLEVAALKSSQNAGGLKGGDIGELRDEVRRLSTAVDPYNDDGANLGQRLEQLNARLDKLERAAGLPSTSSASASSASGAYSPNAYQAVSSPGHYAQTAPAVSGPSLFEEGKSLFDRKDYQGAVRAFKKYLAAEPKGAQADAAQFYIAESLYSRQQYEEAILEYQKVVQGFPKSSQVPTSLLRQGISFQSIKDNDSAKLLYQKVLRDYPKSYAASVARGRLKTL